MSAQFTAPYGVMHAAASFGNYATAHMARFGTTTLDFAHLAVTQRKHASLNKKAVMRESMDTADHQNSRWVVHPFRLLDCCLDITPDDIDLAELYDPFTFMCMVHMEDSGLVRKGEVGSWVAAGKNGLDPEVPVNTHGGLLSEAYVQGLNHVIEAVQQLRPGAASCAGRRKVSARTATHGTSTGSC